jgi:hypothetical protein
MNSRSSSGVDPRLRAPLRDISSRKDGSVVKAIRRGDTRARLHTCDPLGIVDDELLVLERGRDGADEVPDRRIATA